MEIRPKFNIDPETGALSVGPGQQHTSLRSAANLLTPELFNEYERVMSLLADAAGDIDYPSLISGEIGTYGDTPLMAPSVPSTLYEVLDIYKGFFGTIWSSKLSVYGGTVSGTLSVDDVLHARGVVLEWAPNTLYETGTVVRTTANALYICNSEHTSSTNFSDDAGYWELLTAANTHLFSVSVPENYQYSFEPGDCVRYESGLVPALADAGTHHATAVVVRKLSPTRYELATGGFVTFDDDVFASEDTLYYLSSTEPGKLTTTPPVALRQPVLRSITRSSALILLSYFNVGTYIKYDEFHPEGPQDTFILSATPAAKEMVFVSVNGILLDMGLYNISGNTLTIDSEISIGVNDVVTVRYFYGDTITAHTLSLSGYTVGNDAGNVPISNGTLNENLNADMLDGHHAGNATNNVPINNTQLNVGLNADMVDGYHLDQDVKSTASPTHVRLTLSQETGVAPLSVSSTTVNTNFNADMVDGYHLDQDVRTTASPTHVRLTLSQPTGTPPLTVTSTTVNTNLNADMVDGYHAGNANGNIPVSNGTTNTNLNADMVDGYHLDQDVRTTASPTHVRLTLSQTTGASPLSVTSTTVNTNFNADMVDGYHAGNANGNIPVNNGTTNTNLNADMVDGYHLDQDVRNSASPTFVRLTLSQATGTSPLSVTSTTLNANFNADMLDGYHAGNTSGSVPVNNGTLCTALNADMLDGKHASEFLSTGSISKFENQVEFAVATSGSLTDSGEIYIYASGDPVPDIISLIDRVAVEGSSEVYVKGLIATSPYTFSVLKLDTSDESYWPLTTLGESSAATAGYLVGMLALAGGGTRAIYNSATEPYTLTPYDFTYDIQQNTATITPRNSVSISNSVVPSGIGYGLQSSIVTVYGSGEIIEITPSGNDLSYTTYQIQNSPTASGYIPKFARRVGDTIYCCYCKDIDGTNASGELGKIVRSENTFTYTRLAGPVAGLTDEYSQLSLGCVFFGLTPVNYPFFSIPRELYYINQSGTVYSLTQGFTLGVYYSIEIVETYGDTYLLYLHGSQSHLALVSLSGTPRIVSLTSVAGPLAAPGLGTAEHPLRGFYTIVNKRRMVAYEMRDAYAGVKVAPFVVSGLNTHRVRNLNADMIDGKHLDEILNEFPEFPKTFIDLSDTPQEYVANKFLVVNSDATGVEFHGGVGLNNVWIGTEALASYSESIVGCVAIGYQAMSSCSYCGTNVAIGYQASFSCDRNYTNVAIGYKSMYSGTSCSTNVAIGLSAMSGAISTAHSVAIGTSAMISATNVSYSVAIGAESMRSATGGMYNVAIGYESLAINATSHNVAVGFLALCSNTTGSYNVAVGSYALANNVTATDNVAIGYNAAVYNTTGSYNTAVGSRALASNTVGYNNVAVGYQALKSNTTGYSNTAVGYRALGSCTTGINNVAIGPSTLQGVTTGSNNVSVGSESTAYNHNQCTLIGINQAPGAARTNTTCIGYGAPASANNQINLGNTSITQIRAQVTSITSYSSDKRDKADIRDLDLGLDFIMELKPRKFKWDKREWYAKKDEKGMPILDEKGDFVYEREKDGSLKQDEEIIGFIAQEVIDAEDKYNAAWLRISDRSDSNRLSVTPGNVLLPLVKAVQELALRVEEIERMLKSKKET